MLEAGWSGVMSLPRLMHLDPEGTLRLQVLPDTVQLRGSTIPSQGSGSEVLTTLSKANGEMICTGHVDTSFEVSLSANETEIMRVSYSAEKHTFLADGKEVALDPNDQPTLHAFVDGSVIELILSERIGYTKRFYYEGMIAPDVHVRATGKGDVTMKAWKVKQISNDRLT